MPSETWWFHLYVMFSRATRMSDMLLLRPPSREFLERGPPRTILEALRQFDAKEQQSVREAEELCRSYGIALPAKDAERVAPVRHRQRGKRPAFLEEKEFQGRRPGYVFKRGQSGLGYYLDASCT